MDELLKTSDKQFLEDTEIKVEKLKIEAMEQADREKYENYSGKDQIVPVGELCDKLRRIREDDFFIRTNLIEVEKIIDGFRQGELVIISGVTGNGKTLFARTLTEHFSVNAVPCCWFSFEEDTLEFYKKFKIAQFYVPSELKVNKVDWIFDRIKEAKVKFGVKAVFLDHLHYITPMLSQMNNSLVIGQLMRQLKTFAMENRIILFLIAHTSKVNEEEAPDLSHLRDSSFIAQEADKVFFVRRKIKITTENNHITDKIYFAKSTVYVLKNRRNGQMGRVRFKFEDCTLQEISEDLWVEEISQEAMDEQARLDNVYRG